VEVPAHRFIPLKIDPPLNFYFLAVVFFTVVPHVFHEIISKYIGSIGVLTMDRADEMLMKKSNHSFVTDGRFDARNKNKRHHVIIIVYLSKIVTLHTLKSQLALSHVTFTPVK
jgi:hypothetical protein